MKSHIVIFVVIGTLYLCCAAGSAAPDTLHKGKIEASKQKNIQKAQPQSKPTKTQPAAVANETDQPQIENVSVIAKRYAPIFKKATAALNIKKSLTKDEEKRLWADYEAGKYSKNKKFMMYMKQAEPDHKKLRTFVSQFEDLDAVFRVRREQRDAKRFRRP